MKLIEESFPAGVTRERYEAQVALEEECRDVGVQSYRARTTKARTAGFESKTDYGRRFLSQAIAPLSEALCEWRDEAMARPGRRHNSVALMEGIDNDVLALIGARTIIDHLSMEHTMQGCAITIGGKVEDEARFGQLAAQDDGLIAKVKKNLDEGPWKSNLGHRSTVLRHAANKFGKPWVPWTKRDKLSVGMVIVDLFVKRVGLVQISAKRKPKRGILYFIEPTDELVEYLYDYTGLKEILYPDRWPMISRPKPWHDPVGGGYYTKALQRPLVWTKTKGYVEELRASHPQQVYDAINFLQDTAWKINTRILDVAHHFAENGIEVKGLELIEKDRPPYPPGFNPDGVKAERWANVDPQAKADWKMETASIYRKNLKKRGKIFATVKALMVAERLRDEPRIYFPYGVDFRGRFYPCVNVLQPQGTDLAKGLLMFAEGEPLGAEGAWWLAVHIANCWGNDKISLDGRVEFVESITNDILKYAEDPIENQGWMDADKPWEFLAACFEWAGYIREGVGYVCSLRVDSDGTCNGLQILAAASRDETTGALVNLLPGELPADVYQKVADRLTEKLTQRHALLRRLEEADEQRLAKMKNPPEDPKFFDHATLIDQWLEWGITRKYTAKRPVMVTPYGGTLRAFDQYIREGIIEREDKEGVKSPFESRAMASRWLAKLLWECVCEVIPGPMRLMDWFREVSSILVSDGLPISWRMPTGFVCQQVYYKSKAVRVATQIGDKAYKLTIREDTKELNKQKMSQSIAPNWTHAYDSAALTECINLCRDAGLPGFAAVHDSYGCLPSRMGTLGRKTREAYVKIFSRDVIQDFINDALEVLPEGTLLPDPPEYGNLDVEQILNSPYFFH